jgi:hypothetical protein
MSLMITVASGVGVALQPRWLFQNVCAASKRGAILVPKRCCGQGSGAGIEGHRTT